MPNYLKMCFYYLKIIIFVKAPDVSPVLRSYCTHVLSTSSALAASPWRTLP